MRLKINWKFAILVLVAFIVWFFRPIFHGIAMDFYRNPYVLEIIAIIFLLRFFSSLRVRKHKKKESFNPFLFSPSLQFIFAFVIVFFIFTIGTIFSTIFPQIYIAKNYEFKRINTLPETTENIRLMPYEVAYRISRDSLQLSQYKLGKENIAKVNGTISWIFPLIPDGELIKFTLKNKGVIYVDATTQEKNNRIVWKDLEIGDGMYVFDNLYWNLYKKKYFVDLDDPFYVVHNGELYTVVSAINYDIKMFFGVLYSVPKFKGVFIVDSKGNIEFLSPEEALNSEILKGNRLFPENLARYIVESYKYHKGLINKWFIHEDQIEIRDISANNKQPFLMETKEGLKWFISTEPYGESHGIFKIFLVDARTGDVEMYELPVDETLTGPIKAMDFVRQENPIVDWSRFKIVEPLPFIKNNTLWWKVVVIPNDAAGIAYQAFVNAKTNEIVELRTDEEINSFLTTGEKKLDQQQKPPDEEQETKEQKIQIIKQKLREIEDILEELE